MAADVQPNLGTILLVKEMSPGASTQGTRRDGPTTLYSPPNNEELNHAEARLTFVCFLFWVSFEKTVLLLCEV